ncbi:MAG: hypothetical protein KAW93_03300 [Methanogenium sp.]|nr:hypothetical protein [Methanogenium sp.]
MTDLQGFSKNIYFSQSEFECPCCKICFMNQAFLRKLTQARFRANVPFIINSGYRCRDHNKEVGGRPESTHLCGIACDINCTTGSMRHKIIFGLICAGFTRIGISKTFIHVDNSATLLNAFWLYK